MDKRIVLCSLAFLLALSIVFSVGAVDDRDAIYPFDEPSDLYWKASQYSSYTYRCPENNSVEEIRKIVDKLEIIKDRLSDEDIQGFKEECDNYKWFTREAFEPEGEIKECFDYLSAVLARNDIYPIMDNLVKGYDRWLYRECYVRSYFNERFNPDTIEDYDYAYFTARLVERDEEFVDFIRYKIEYPKSSLEEAVEVGKEPVILEEKSLNLSEIGDDPAELAKYDLNPVIVEKVNIPSKSVLQVIAEKIKSFFNWFR